MSRILASAGVWMGDLEKKIRPLKTDDVKHRLAQAGIPDDKHDAIIADLSALPMDLQAHQATWDAGGDAAAVRDHVHAIRTAARELGRLLDDPLARPAMDLARARTHRAGHGEYYDTVRGLADALLTAEVVFRYVENELEVSPGGNQVPHAVILAEWTVAIFRRHGLPIAATRKGLLTQVFGQVLEAANIKRARTDAPLRRAIRDIGLG